MVLSVCIIAHNEELNIVRTLESVKGIADEIVVVDSGSTDNTIALAQSCGAKVFVEEWKGFAQQQNSALAKAAGVWILSLHADEEVSRELAANIKALLRSGQSVPQFDGYMVARRNFYLNRWLQRGGFYPDRKLRLIKRGLGAFEIRPVHENMKTAGRVGRLSGDLIHHACPTLESFIEHQNRYSSLGGQMVADERTAGFSLTNIVLRPLVGFMYRYFVRRGFLDGREGLLVHLNHAAYVSWKYAKAWEITKDACERRTTGRW